MSPLVHSRLWAETVEYSGLILRGAGTGIFVIITRLGLCPTELPVGELPGTLSPDVSGQREQLIYHIY